MPAACYNGAKASAANGSTAQVTAAAQILAFGYIKPDIQANKANSSFIIASGKQTALSPYFSQFVVNADQWDGYNAERKALMQHLRSRTSTTWWPDRRHPRLLCRHHQRRL